MRPYIFNPITGGVILIILVLVGGSFWIQQKAVGQNSGINILYDTREYSRNEVKNTGIEFTPQWEGADTYECISNNGSVKLKNQKGDTSITITSGESFYWTASDEIRTDTVLILNAYKDDKCMATGRITIQYENDRFKVQRPELMLQNKK